MYKKNNWKKEEVKAALADTYVKRVVQKNVRMKTIQLINKESNQPIFNKEMQLIGERGDRAINETPKEDNS